MSCIQDVNLLCVVAEPYDSTEVYSEKTEAEGITCLISTSETQTSFQVGKVGESTWLTDSGLHRDSSSDMKKPPPPKNMVPQV